MDLNFIKEDMAEEWDDFVIRNEGNFLQSFEWGNLQETILKKVFRLEVKSLGQVLLQAQVIKEKILFKNYFYIPYGPVFGLRNSLEDNFQSLKLFLKEVKKLAKKEKAVFLRVEPIFPLPDFGEFNFQDAPKRIQPKKTLILNLEKSEGDLLKSFKKRTRYNIKLAEKRGVLVDIKDDYSDDFYKLLKKTKERQEFRSYPEEYYKELLKIKGERLAARLFLAKFEKRPVAATLTVSFGERITTLHSGFDYQYRELKAPYLLRWRIAQQAKKDGLEECDFWGINEEKWPGVTRLKKSFRGRELEYGSGKDIIFDDGWYRAYKVMRKIL